MFDFEAAYYILGKHIKSQLFIFRADDTTSDQICCPPPQPHHLVAIGLNVFIRLQCDQMIENHEEDIEDWYMNHSGQDPLDYVCSNKVLKGNDTGE